MFILNPLEKLRMLICLSALIIAMFIGSNQSYALSESEMQNSALLASKAWTLLGSGRSQDNIKKAEQLFQQAIALDPRNADAYAGMGRAIYMKGHITDDVYKKDACREAMVYFDKAASLDKNDEFVHYLKSDAYRCLEDYDNAIKEADLLVNTPCTEHFLRARAYVEKIKANEKKVDKRLATIEAVDYLACVNSMASSQNMSNPYNLLRSTLLVTQEVRSTARYLKKRIQERPHDGRSYYNYYWLLLLKTEWGYLDDTDVIEAEETINKAKSVVNYSIGTIQEIHLQRGEYYFKRKLYDKAFIEYTGCLVASPDYSWAKHRMSYLCSQLPDSRCIEAWQKIIRAYLSRGDCKNAVKEFPVQYSKHPSSFEQFKDAIAQCKRGN